MNKKGGIFFLRIALIFVPLLALLSVYVVTDPFKVLRTYHFDNYYDWQRWELNRELASVSNLKYRIAERDTPDSYIFGNSQSFFFRCSRWEFFLNDHSHPFHFDAVNETLFGFRGKVRFLDSRQIKIKNALLVCDISLLAMTENNHNIKYIKQPDISGEPGLLYQAAFLKAYFTNSFFVKQIDYLLFHKERGYMDDILPIHPGYVRTEPYLNDIFYEVCDSMLKADSIGYYKLKAYEFPPRPAMPDISKPVIGAAQIKMLEEIKAIFDKDHTSFKIVISPLYNRRKINDADVATMKKIFGEGVVYDYTGQNEITASQANYYDGAHYKPYITDQIMSRIYSK